MSTSMFDYELPDGDTAKDGLFLERLDTFMEKCLGDIRAFAERELRPYEETRRCIAQWHAKYLFQSHVSPSATALSKDALSRSAQVRSVLSDTSRILEGLSATSGVQSFLLAVDPNDASDGGFLGGSVIGREFWRGLRGGGEHGARAFKGHCSTHLQNAATTSSRNASQAPNLERQVSTPPPKGGPAKSIKNELYESVRTALRLASGVRSAEMKWTNPERLDVYGVRLVGWPEGVPAQNPSTLKVGQNRLLLDAIQSGSMRFERNPQGHPSNPRDNVDGDDPNEDFSWAYDADARPASPPREHSTPATTPSLPDSRVGVVDSLPVPATSTDKSESDNSPWSLDPTMPIEPTLSSYSVDYALGGGELNEHMMDTTTPGEEWTSESNSDSQKLGRPRKRPRSEDSLSRIEDSKLS